MAIKKAWNFDKTKEKVCFTLNAVSGPHWNECTKNPILQLGYWHSKKV